MLEALRLYRYWTSVNFSLTILISFAQIDHNLVNRSQGGKIRC